MSAPPRVTVSQYEDRMATPKKSKPTNEEWTADEVFIMKTLHSKGHSRSHISRVLKELGHDRNPEAVRSKARAIGISK